MTLGTTAQAAPLSATDDEILEILAARIDAQKQSVGIVVGIIDAEGKRVVAHGRLEKDDARPPDGNTVFEIGSVTKVFTALALADTVERGGVQLDTPVSQLLPESVVLRQATDGKPITLKHLATHMSGLPRLPGNLVPADDNDPYADYGVAKLYAFLSSHQPTRPPGGEHEYSNLGYGLLGHLLALQSGQSYEALVSERITVPLGMADTAITALPEWQGRRATGHDAGLEPTSDWDLGALQGAGALRSTANDLLIFLQAAMGKKPSTLAPAFSAMLRNRQPLGDGTAEQALGWVISGQGDRQIVWHNGGTGGYRSFVGFRPSTGVGVVVLSNTSTEIGVDDIGEHLLDRESPLAHAPVQRIAITVDPATYDAYLGTFRLAPGFDLTVFRDGNRLFAQATGQGPIELFAEAEHRFFAKSVDAQMTFKVGAGARAASLTLHQNGQDSLAPRVSD
ncbi:serine hydrolase [Ensifer sp. HO-A22]|uniref:Serine hydrolase n=1 Tax=Ensifer oleiphilus TaxID=2742698 RepID=A0A7Y6UKH1_9HYPH|nr:serine hydrolase [Ensifer oleiphilus]NVD37276.1 serine hydrolase [Ensifer oleiphilus]